MNWRDFKCGFFYGIITALLIWFSIFLVLNWGTDAPSSSSVGGVGDTAPLTIFNVPSLEQIQEAIGVEPDGIYGEQTRKAWDLALCEQMNQESWIRMANPIQGAN